MYIHTGHSRAGTNLYHHFDKTGQVEIKDGKDRYVYYISGGTIAGYDHYTNRAKVRELRYGQYLRSWKDGKLTQDDTIKANTICTIVPKVHYEKIPATLYGRAGTLTLKKYGGSLRGESFTYKGKCKQKIAYAITRGTKAAKAGFTVYAPNGQAYAKYTGAINFSWRHGRGNGLLYHRTKDGSTWDMIKGSEFVNPEAINNLFDSRHYTVEVYDANFKVKLSGHVVNGQKVDKWIVDGRESYFIQGVEISAKLYNATPDQLDPQEVLAIPNSQVRAAFIKKIGFERIVQKLGGKVLHTDPRGYELIELASGLAQNESRVDPIIRLLKVKCPSTGAFYTLRVPPGMENCEQARQWTFGVNEPTPENQTHEYFELEKET